MKNNSMTITIADNMEVTSYSAWIGQITINELVSRAYGVEENSERKKFMARIAIKIEDLSEPLRIERPEGPEEEAQA